MSTGIGQQTLGGTAPKLAARQELDTGAASCQ